MNGGKALLFALLVLGSGLAGCASNAATKDHVSPGSTSGGVPLSQPSPVSEFKPRGTSERWHFHDYWHGSPTITLFEGNVSLNATLAADGLPAVGALLALPHGVIVPPETGFLTLNASWSPDTLGTVNFTYRPSDSNDYQPIGDLADGVVMQLNTTESNCDVPHRQESLWRFNFTARPAVSQSVPPSGLPPQSFHLTINATIGRPLFIDPPHLNWWRDGNVLTIVEAASGDIRTAKTPATNLTLPGGLPAPTTTPPSLSDAEKANTTFRIPVDAGRIVPEGAISIVAVLNWSSTAPAPTKLALRYHQSNDDTAGEGNGEGAMDVAVDGAGHRVFSMKVTPPMTDTTYSNRTTWEFRVIPEGDNAAAFDGTFTLVAWTTKLEPPDAVALLAKA